MLQRGDKIVMMAGCAAEAVRQPLQGDKGRPVQPHMIRHRLDILLNQNSRVFETRQRRDGKYTISGVLDG